MKLTESPRLAIVSEVCGAHTVLIDIKIQITDTSHSALSKNTQDMFYERSVLTAGLGTCVVLKMLWVIIAPINSA